jgi:phenylpyruvate tautomerase PptA (4-oxalocrotonate tautomerase family)
VPVCRIEAPPGIGIAAKKKMVEQITAAIDEAYHIGDTLVFLQECAPEMLRWMGDCCRKILESRRFCRRSVPEPARSDAHGIVSRFLWLTRPLGGTFAQLVSAFQKS